MPVSRETTDGLAAEVAASYARAEVRLLQLIAKHLEAGHESPEWAERKLAELQVFRRRAEKIAAEAYAEASAAVGEALERAYLRGAAAGNGDAARLGIDLDDIAPGNAERAIRALVIAQRGRLGDLSLPIVRAIVDAYREAVSRAVVGTLTGATTRLQDAQHVLDQLARRGITGFVDTAGRQWGLQSYVEMSVRTTTAHAAVEGHLDRLEQAGIPLVIVSDSPRECPICRPWEGKVLSRGPVAALLPNALTGRMESVHIDGTVAEAIAAGLFHPNCTHNLSGFIPGATERGAGSNAEGYAERQQLRALERKVREWKRREAVAMSPEARRRASGKVREWQGRIREHTEATGLARKRNRESLTAAR